MKITLALLVVLSCHAQPWSTFLDSSRAIDWTSGVGFSIPSYTVPCSTQPSLGSGSGNAAANTTAIQNALASCDATHNVVNLPSGTYYIAGVQFGTQGKQVLRGAGSSATYLNITADAGCAGLGHGVCMLAGNWTYSGDSSVQPPSGIHQCAWTAGYSQGTTSITLGTCGGTPTVGQLIVLDQANDTSDTSGVYTCDGSTSNCTYEGARNANGRVIGSDLYSTQEVKSITGVTSLGGGSYTVTISPAVYETNIRTGQTPGAWFPGTVQLEGIENLTLDATAADNALGFFSCYQCWAKGLRFIDPARNAILLYQSLQVVIRDSYFFGAQSSAATSYNIECDTSSSFLVENNIMQQVTTPLNMNGGCEGAVVDYNLSIKTIFADGTWTWPLYASHSADDNFNLYEGNNTYGIAADNASGPANQFTAFRNFFTGFELGTINTTVPFIFRALNRNINIVGNVLGQPSYHTQYQAFATSTTTFSGAASGDVSIYDLGGGGTGDVCSLNPGSSTLCDPLTVSTLMRWGNYDIVNAAARWDSTEASPASNTYVNANFSSGYFSGLAHTLPASLAYNSKPSWWPSAKPWPTIGPDISSGNIGICTGGTYAGAPATGSGQCTGGSLSTAWASHANSIPAQDCFISMGGPADGSGGVLAFDAGTCYSNSTATASSSIAGPIRTAGPVSIHPLGEQLAQRHLQPGALAGDLVHAVEFEVPQLADAHPGRAQQQGRAGTQPVR